jgi:hypothetical protein
MTSTIDNVLEAQLATVSAAIQSKGGMTLEELEKELKSKGQFDSSVDLRTIVGILYERGAVNIGDDQKLTFTAVWATPLEVQLATVLAAIQSKGGMTLKELEKELKGQFDSSVDLGTIVEVLRKRGAVKIGDDQKLIFTAVWAPPPLPPRPNLTSSERELRLHPEPRLSTDPRKSFVRDRERIIFSSAFRRLAGVTQVFPAKAAGHNRMIHSVKAGHIARSMVQQWMDNYQTRTALEKKLIST